MRKPAETVDSFVIAECGRISRDPNETPERRRVAAEWLIKLIHSGGQGWEGGGQTVAEKAGVEVDPKAPGGQKAYFYPSHGGRVDTHGPDIEAGELSSELHSSQRNGHWRARERHYD